jgi:hypothetical protein
MEAKTERLYLNWLMLVLTTNVCTIMLTSQFSQPILTTMFGFSVVIMVIMSGRVMLLNKKIRVAAPQMTVKAS